jgi:hypothetical protein
MAKTPAGSAADAPLGDSVPTTTPPRKIPGNLPYLTSSGTLKKVLDKIIDAQLPPRFNADFLENVLNLKGGTARATIPILKKMGFVSSDGTPTDLYSKFRTNGGRGAAALKGLENGFAEIFRKSTYAHNVPDGKLRDIIVEVTGLPANDPIVTAIRGTFNAAKSFVPGDIVVDGAPATELRTDDVVMDRGTANEIDKDDNKAIRLSYNINIVLPETSDLTVLNAIFRSIKENLMK